MYLRDEFERTYLIKDYASLKTEKELLFKHSEYKLSEISNIAISMKSIGKELKNHELDNSERWFVHGVARFIPDSACYTTPNYDFYYVRNFDNTKYDFVYKPMVELYNQEEYINDYEQ